MNTFYPFQTFIEEYYNKKPASFRRRLLVKYLATLSDSDKKALLWQLKLAPKTVEKLLAIK
jgi:hypothetical protein